MSAEEHEEGTYCRGHSGYNERIKTLERENGQQRKDINEIKKIGYKLLGGMVLTLVGVLANIVLTMAKSLPTP